MAWIVGDGFDTYSGANPTAVGGLWDAGFGSVNYQPGVRFPPGRYLTPTSIAQTWLQKTFANETTIYIVFAFQLGSALGAAGTGNYIQLLDSGTAQVTIWFQADGSIVLRSGGPAGTVLATYAGAYAGLVAGIWYHFQMRVVIDPTAGSFTVRKNGSGSDSFSATGLNTRGGTANTRVNSVAFVVPGSNSFNNDTFRMDDCLIYSGSGAAPNTWIGDCRAVVLSPAGDIGTPGWTPVPVGIVTTDGTFFSTTQTCPANGGLCGSVMPSRGGMLTKASVMVNAAITGKLKMAIYNGDASNNNPGTLLATSPTEITNPGAGAVVDFLWPTPVYLRSQQSLWFIVIANANVDLRTTSSASPQGHRVSATGTIPYTGGFPATFPTALTQPGGFDFLVQLTYTGNSTQLSEYPPDGDTTYVWSITPGQTDYYAMPSFGVFPAPADVIVGMNTRAYVRKGDATPRQMQTISPPTRPSRPPSCGSTASTR
jgi:hypothetical protein